MDWLVGGRLRTRNEETVTLIKVDIDSELFSNIDIGDIQ